MDIEEKRAAREAEREEARKAQEKADDEGIFNAEEALDGEPCTYVRVAYRRGFPVKIGVRALAPFEYKRFRAAALKERLDDKTAADLAKKAVIYPDAATFESMLGSFAGLADTVTGVAAKLSQGRAVDEGKD